VTLVRRPAVAGTFYPSRPDDLRAAITNAFAGVDTTTDDPGDHTRVPKALVAPHAGYVYSGAIAATAYARIAAAHDRIERVVLLGPAHRVWLEGVAASGYGAWRTPLGDVAIDRPLNVPVDDLAHADEHSLEVHVPFLQTVLGDGFTLVPLVVGHASPHHVAALLDDLWGGDETLVVVSTDLSHYHDHATATDLDRATAARIVTRDYEGIGDHDACGAYPLRGLLFAATQRGLDVELLDLRNSGDTAGPPDRVVGYGAFAVSGRR
jgi:AmmeMemoRadiSam system protein B